jgi:DNA-binding CsgD family transcriptional regulator
MADRTSDEEARTLLALIGEIYDAALEPALWSDVLGKLARFVPGMSAAIFAKDAANRTGNVYYDDGGISPQYKQLYFEKYVKLDPANAGHFFSEIGVPVSTVDLLPYDEFLETRFYREWVKPQGIVDFVSSVLDKTPTSAALFGVFRHEQHGLIDDDGRRRMRLVIPHVRRAVLIGKVIDLKTAEAATLADTLDSIAAGMFLVDSRGQIVHANAMGHTILANGDLLRVTGGKLAASDARANQALADVFALAGSGDGAVGVKGIALPLTASDGQRFVAHVLPLTSGGRRRTAASFSAVAAVFVRKAALEIQSPPEVIAKAYKLTPSELRVLLAIVEVGGVPEVSEALGVAETTVKTHLSRIYKKTGTNRQAEVVKLVASYTNPLVR